MKNTQKIDKTNSWKIFDQIYPHYDRINRILSLGSDIKWREKLVDFAPKKNISLLDIATGSADQILAFSKKKELSKVVGIDLSEKMLDLAKEKTAHLPFVTFRKEDAQNLLFPSNTFDCVSCSFGIRNIPDYEKALQEMYRVLQKDGVLLILEFSIPSHWLNKILHTLYLRSIVPIIGGLLSKNYFAYSYLNKTIHTFPYGKKFCEKIRLAGFREVKDIPLHLGALSLYKGIK